MKDQNSRTQSVIDRRKMSLMDKKLVAKDQKLLAIGKLPVIGMAAKDQKLPAIGELAVIGMVGKDQELPVIGKLL